MAKRVGMKYIGNGFFVVGVPARDLSVDEVEKFGEAFLLKSGLYKKVGATRKTTTKKPAESREE